MDENLLVLLEPRIERSPLHPRQTSDARIRVLVIDDDRARPNNVTGTQTERPRRPAAQPP